MRFKVGDSAWSAHVGRTARTVSCPVCFGKREVVLILGNDERVTLSCDYCGKGYDGPQGNITEYVFVAEPELVTVASVEILSDSRGERVRYTTANHYCFDELFETSEEARAAATARAAEIKKDEETRTEFIKKNAQKSFAWNAGYHMREAKQLRERAVYHDRMAVLCKERTAERKEQLKAVKALGGGGA